MEIINGLNFNGWNTVSNFLLILLVAGLGLLMTFRGHKIKKAGLEMTGTIITIGTFFWQLAATSFVGVALELLLVWIIAERITKKTGKPASLIGTYYSGLFFLASAIVYLVIWLIYHQQH